jgi:sugar/nucleoside kinase (ribokinase family)
VPDVVCLGLLVADVIARPLSALPEPGTVGLLDEISLHGGGCALNTGTGLARLGLDVAVAGKVGVDPFGDYLLGLLDERGLDRRAVLRDPAIATSAAVVMVDEEGERTFLHLPGANGTLSVRELDSELLLSGRALHIAGALLLASLDGEPMAALLAEARRRQLFTSLDTVWDAAGGWARIEPCLPHLDLITPSLLEARAISGEREPAAAAAWLRERGVLEVAIKLGAAGCYVAGDEFVGHLDAVRVRAVDGTGAGDAFAAGILYGKLAGWPLERAARLGNAAGALAVTEIGAAEGVRGLQETLSVAGIE